MKSLLLLSIIWFLVIFLVLINLLSSGKEALHILGLTVVLAQKIMKKNSFFYGQNKDPYTEKSLELL